MPYPKKTTEEKLASQWERQLRYQVVKKKSSEQFREMREEEEDEGSQGLFIHKQILFRFDKKMF